MEQIRGYCLRVCNDCTIFQATQQDDDIMRADIAAILSENNDMKINPEDINCDGCSAENGRLFLFARTCTVRIKEAKNKKPEYADNIQ